MNCSQCGDWRDFYGEVTIGGGEGEPARFEVPSLEGAIVEKTEWYEVPTEHQPENPDDQGNCDCLYGWRPDFTSMTGYTPCLCPCHRSDD